MFIFILLSSFFNMDFFIEFFFILNLFLIFNLFLVYFDKCLRFFRSIDDFLLGCFMLFYFCWFLIFLLLLFFLLNKNLWLFFLLRFICFFLLNFFYNYFFFFILPINLSFWFSDFRINYFLISGSFSIACSFVGLIVLAGASFLIVATFLGGSVWVSVLLADLSNNFILSLTLNPITSVSSVVEVKGFGWLSWVGFTFCEGIVVVTGFGWEPKLY